MKNTVTALFRPLLVAGLVSLGAQTMPALAQTAQIAVSSASYGGVRDLDIELNKSIIVDLPAGVAEVIVSQPNVAAAIMRTRTRAIVQGIGGGDTNIFFIDDNGRTIQVLDLRVIKEPSQVGNALEEALARVIPGSKISVESVTLRDETNRVVLTGTVLSSDDKMRAEQVAIQFAGKPENVANILDVSGAQQVMLQVTVSEIRRADAMQLGINLSGTVTLAGGSIGFNNTSPVAVSNGVSGGFNVGNTRIDAEIRALEQRGALRLLAQPTLTAMSGESAEFLVGGELPYRTLDSDGKLTTNFKPYGVNLKFTPVVRSNGSVNIAVETGVSEVQPGPQGEVTLSRRDVKTSVELPVGSTLAIGGLLDERVSRAVDQLPGLANVPILGALFRSNNFKREETELVILVTPYLVGPAPVNTIAVPTDFVEAASDAEAIFLGRLEKQYGVSGHGGMRGGFSGSVGFVLE